MRLYTIVRTGILVASLALAGSAAADDASVTPEELLAARKSGEKVLVLDVRTPEEYESGHVPGAVNIPHDELASRVAEVKDEVKKKDASEVVVYCEAGRRAGMAEETLRENGVENVKLLEGHMKQWRSDGRPTE